MFTYRQFYKTLQDKKACQQNRHEKLDDFLFSAMTFMEKKKRHYNFVLQHVTADS